MGVFVQTWCDSLKEQLTSLFLQTWCDSLKEQLTSLFLQTQWVLLKEQLTSLFLQTRCDSLKEQLTSLFLKTRCVQEGRQVKVGKSNPFMVSTEGRVASAQNLTPERSHGGCKAHYVSVTHPFGDHARACLTLGFESEHSYSAPPTSKDDQRRSTCNIGGLEHLLFLYAGSIPLTITDSKLK